MRRNGNAEKHAFWLAAAALVVASMSVGAWLAWRYIVDQAYGRSVMAHSLSMFEEGRIHVVQFLLSEGVMPADAAHLDFVPIENRVGIARAVFFVSLASDAKSTSRSPGLSSPLFVTLARPESTKCSSRSPRSSLM